MKFVNERTKRKETEQRMTADPVGTKNIIRFKEILLELHRGAEPAALFDQFHEIINSANQQEADEIQRQLIIEGVPTQQVKKWSSERISSYEN